MNKSPLSTSDVAGGGKAERSNFVRVRGARENNLKKVDVDIPRDALVVFTGISGSGKSSLAFGTLYAEAQRRYFESVAPYARRLIDQVGVPEVSSIDGLPPAVALQQQRSSPNARSSVGSLTTLSSLVRVLYSRAGEYPPNQPMLYAEDFSPNTVEGACPICHGLGRVYDATEKSMVPDPSLTIRERAVAAWPPAWHGQNLRDILVALGYDVHTPWRDLPEKDRNWILFTEEQPTVGVYAGLTPQETRAALKRGLKPSYKGTFTGARRYVLQTFANTKSALMKRRVAQFMVSHDCPACHGKQLKREALSVRFAGLDIAEFGDLSLLKLMDLLSPVARGEFASHDAGGSAHRSPPDIRHTSNLPEEKRMAARRMASELLERLAPLIDPGLGYLLWTEARRHCLRANCNAYDWRLNYPCSSLAWSTCWTNRLPGCIRRTARRCSSSLIASSAQATRCLSSSTISTLYVTPNGW
jgi:excinuclease ABC subunit A